MNYIKKSDSNFLQIFLIIFVIFIADIAVEIYVPALPGIMHFFNADQSAVKLTVGCNIIGLAFSSLFYGALSDHYGRKPVMIAGMLIFAVSSALCVFSASIFFLTLFRLFQGMGQGVAVVVGFASIRDVYSGDQCAKIISRISMVAAVSPAFAPIIGSFILTYSGWELIFALLFLFGIFSVFVLLFFFQETLHSKKNKQKFCIKNLFTSYANILKNRSYLMYSAVAVLNFVWLWNVIASTPFLLMERMGVSIAEYGYLIALNVSGFVLGTILNQIYVVKLGVRKMIQIGIFMPLATEILVLFLHYTGVLTAIILQSIWFFSALGLAFVIGNCTAAALDQVKSDQSSKATAVLVFVEMTLSAAGIYINDMFYMGNVVSISVFTIVCVVISVIVLYAQLLFVEGTKSARKTLQKS